MSRPLAVLTPIVGVQSETFIRRHMEHLLPGGAVVVADTAGPPYGGHWAVDAPTLFLREAPAPGIVRRAVAHLHRRLGAPNGSPGRVAAFLRDYGVRVALGEYLDWSVPWLDAARAAGARFFVHGHGYDLSMCLRDPHWRAAYLRYRRADGVIVPSAHAKARLVDLGLDPASIHVIPYGVEVPPKQLPSEERHTVRCLAVGRMVGKKGPVLTLDAFRRASEAHPNLTLDYVGSGDLLPAVRQFIAAFGLGSRVTLHGGQPHEVVLRLLGQADIFMQHSLTDADTGDEEGVPLAILEAMAYGVPVVSTVHAGIPEAVLDQVTGYLVREGDSVAMAECVIALARDAGLRRRLGAAGRARVQERFAWPQQREALLQVLGLP